MSYSRFIAALQDKGILLDRKMLAHLAATKPAVFTEIVNTVSTPTKKKAALKKAEVKEEAAEEAVA